MATCPSQLRARSRLYKSGLRREAHAFQEVGVAGIGTERIEVGSRLDVRQKAASLRVSFHQQAERTIFFSQKGMVPSDPRRINIDALCLLFLERNEAFRGATIP